MNEPLILKSSRSTDLCHDIRITMLMITFVNSTVCKSTSANYSLTAMP